MKSQISKSPRYFVIMLLKAPRRVDVDSYDLALSDCKYVFKAKSSSFKEDQWVIDCKVAYISCILYPSLVDALCSSVSRRDNHH